MTPVLLSRGFDPVLGIFTGCFAYYLYETNPRTARAPDERLTALVQWKWAKWKHARHEQFNAREREAETSSRVPS